MPAPRTVREISVRFPALDGFSLGGTVFVGRNAKSSSTVVLFSCGGGLQAARYARFARYLAAHGVPVLTYDYRGIGTSRPERLRGFNAHFEDWSELDCGGAITYLRSIWPDSEAVAISHSIGALIAGGAPNIGEIGRFVFVCPHTGYYKDYIARFRLPMALVWHGVMPLLTRVFGYFPARLLRLGEDIPAGVALQWAARRTPELLPEATTIDARRARSMISRYSTVTGETLAIGFSDDAFATELGMKRLLSAFPAMRQEIQIILPADVGMIAVGHFGFFRRGSEASIWPLLLRFVRRSEQAEKGAP